jgi:hypothetical protein
VFYFNFQPPSFKLSFFKSGTAAFHKFFPEKFIRAFPLRNLKPKRSEAVFKSGTAMFPSPLNPQHPILNLSFLRAATPRFINFSQEKFIM